MSFTKILVILQMNEMIEELFRYKFHSFDKVRSFHIPSLIHHSTFEFLVAPSAFCGMCDVRLVWLVVYWVVVTSILQKCHLISKLQKLNVFQDILSNSDFVETPVRHHQIWLKHFLTPPPFISSFHFSSLHLTVHLFISSSHSSFLFYFCILISSSTYLNQSYG